MLVDSYDLSDRVLEDATEERRHMRQQAAVLSPKIHEVHSVCSESVNCTDSPSIAS